MSTASPAEAGVIRSADGALGTVPDTFSQALIMSRYQFRDYLRSRRFVLMMAIVLGAGVILTTVVGYYRPTGIIDNANDLYGNLGGGLPFVILFAGIIFGGDAIAGEFQNKTGYFLMGLPIKRGSVYVGKYLAALAASVVAMAVYILIVVGNAVFYLGSGAFSDPLQLLESLALSVLYLLALLGFVFLFSSLFKTSLYAVLVVAVMFLFGFTILQEVVTMLAHIEPWFLLSYARRDHRLPADGGLAPHRDGAEPDPAPPDRHHVQPHLCRGDRRDGGLLHPDGRRRLLPLRAGRVHVTPASPAGIERAAPLPPRKGLWECVRWRPSAMGDQDLSTELVGQGYQLVGKHSAVKICYWTRESLVRGRDCYKGRFYGIESHRCLQMSPAIDSCNLHCRFCWRNQGWENDAVMPEYRRPRAVARPVDRRAATDPLGVQGGRVGRASAVGRVAGTAAHRDLVDR